MFWEKEKNINYSGLVDDETPDYSPGRDRVKKLTGIHATDPAVDNRSMEMAVFVVRSGEWALHFGKWHVSWSDFGARPVGRHVLTRLS